MLMSKDSRMFWSANSKHSICCYCCGEVLHLPAGLVGRLPRNTGLHGERSWNRAFLRCISRGGVYIARNLCGTFCVLTLDQRRSEVVWWNERLTHTRSFTFHYHSIGILIKSKQQYTKRVVRHRNKTNTGLPRPSPGYINLS